MLLVHGRRLVLVVAALRGLRSEAASMKRTWTRFDWALLILLVGINVALFATGWHV